VYENRALRIFGPKTEVTRQQRKFHNEEPHNLYSLQNIIRVIKLKRMKWVGHIACIGDMINAYNIWM
jgi:hypothetical protein